MTGLVSGFSRVGCPSETPTQNKPCPNNPTRATSKSPTGFARTAKKPSHDVDVDAAWSRFTARNELGAAVTPLRRRTLPTIWRIAAGLVAVAGGADAMARRAPTRRLPATDARGVCAQRTANLADARRRHARVVEWRKSPELLGVERHRRSRRLPRRRGVLRGDTQRGARVSRSRKARCRPRHRHAVQRSRVREPAERRSGGCRRSRRAECRLAWIRCRAQGRRPRRAARNRNSDGCSSRIARSLRRFRERISRARGNDAS